MERRTIGQLSVSVVGLGCNNFGSRIDAEQAAAVVQTALDEGINLFDTADIYGATRSEEFLGRALGARRDQAVVATKFGIAMDADRMGGASAAYIARAVEESLRRLGTDRIDLYQIHRPDPETDITETMEALDRLVKAGKVREIGCSNFTAAQLRDASAAARGARFASVQNEYSLMRREPETDGVLDACAELRIAFMPYFPLASGLLTGKYRKDRPAPEGSRIGSGGRFEGLLAPENLEVVERLIEIAESRGRSILELAVSWLLSKESVASVIAGATRPEQVRANAAAASWRLTSGDLQAIDAAAPAPA